MATITIAISITVHPPWARPFRRFTMGQANAVIEAQPAIAPGGAEGGAILT
jgi:hypothetical protein